MAPVTYTAVCERVGDWWEITVPELESGRVTQARKLSDVDATVRDLVALMTGADPASIEIREEMAGDHGAGHHHDHPARHTLA
jgi:hypothetical protein